MQRIAIALILSLATMTACASGTRSADVSQALAAGFPLLDAAQLPLTLHYIGSSTDDHVFMTVKTAVANGRPFDHLFAYRYPRKSLEIVNGWSLPEHAVHVRPRDCPPLTVTARQVRFALPDNLRLRQRCLPSAER
jgi:hypothetical protein